MTNNKWTTSENGEIYRGEEYDTKEECIRLETEDRKSWPNPDDGFWVGQIQECHTGEFVSCDSLIDNAVCQAEDVCGEVAEDYLSDLKDEKLDELNALVIKWLDDNGFKPTFFKIKNSEFIKFNNKETKVTI